MYLQVQKIAKRKGIKIKDLISDLELSRTAGNSLMSGNPTIKNIIKIANVLDVDVRELIIPTKDLNPMEKLDKAVQLIEEARAEIKEANKAKFESSLAQAEDEIETGNYLTNEAATALIKEKIASKEKK